MAGTALLAAVALRATNHASASSTGSLLIQSSEQVRPLWVYRCLLCLLAMQSSAAAQAPANKWSFQRTGFRTIHNYASPQTALSMRSGETWPVVYGIDGNSLNAYSLFPVVNPAGNHNFQPATNWHQIGSNLAGSQPLLTSAYLQADSSSPDGFAVSVQSNDVGSKYPDVAAIGNSTSGFQSPMIGVQVVKFDDDGNAITASNTLLPNLSWDVKLFDIAVSPFGDVGAVTQTVATNVGTSAITYWQQSSLLGNKWLSTSIPIDARSESPLIGPSVDLNFDSVGRPHIVGVSKSNKVMAYRFDAMTGGWVSSTLDSPSNPPIADIVDVAAASNDDGILGAAWVKKGVLKYAYLDTKEISPSWVVTNVAATTPTGLQLAPTQGVGLAFDHAGLPEISFVDAMRQIWIAYDPPTAFGGGVTDQPGAEGDFNGDGLVDGYDVDAWTTGFGEGTLTGNDFLAWQRNVSASASPAATAPIPEPSTLACGLMGSAIMLSSAKPNRRSLRPGKWR